MFLIVAQGLLRRLWCLAGIKPIGEYNLENLKTKGSFRFHSHLESWDSGSMGIFGFSRRTEWYTQRGTHIYRHRVKREGETEEEGEGEIDF